MATALALAQERYDHMTDDQGENPASAAVDALLQHHPDFQLTQTNVEDGLREMDTAKWDDFYADLQTFMVYEDRGLSELMRGKALSMVASFSQQVRSQWKADAEQMHKDATEGYEQ